MDNVYCVVRPKGSVIVSIMWNRADSSYHFVNLTHGHICKCSFPTVEAALEDMDNLKKEGKVISYTKIDTNVTTK